MKNHEYFMRHCIELAKKALANGNPPVGAVLVKQGKIVAQGMESCEPDGDSTDHAEIEAVRDGVRKLNQKDLSDCSLYTTHEPCIMCAYVIRHHAIHQVVIGCRVESIGGVSSKYPILAADDIEVWDAPPLIVENVCSQECKALSHRHVEGQVVNR